MRWNRVIKGTKAFSKTIKEDELQVLVVDAINKLISEIKEIKEIIRGNIKK